MISNWTGRPVFFWTIGARCRTFNPEQTSSNRSLTKSEARSLLSIARLKIARLRLDRAISRRTRMDQTCLGSRGLFWPTRRNAVEQQVGELDRKVMKLARHDAQVRRFMTVPGVGPITGLAFKATIDDPARFARSRSVGAYVGLTCRRHASGEVDWSGRISKCGDAMLRSYLFEASGVLLTRVLKWSALKACGVNLVKGNGRRKDEATFCLKLAVILHRMWIDGTEFNWSKKEIAA